MSISQVLDQPTSEPSRPRVYTITSTHRKCVSHEGAGNVGRIVVGWPAPDTQIAIEQLIDDEHETIPSQVANAFECFDEETHPLVEYLTN